MGIPNGSVWEKPSRRGGPHCGCGNTVSGFSHWLGRDRGETWVAETGQKEDFYEKLQKYITVTVHKYGESFFTWNTKFPKAHF